MNICKRHLAAAFTNRWNICVYEWLIARTRRYVVTKCDGERFWSMNIISTVGELFLLDIFYRGSVPFLPFPIVPWCVSSKRYSWHERKANGTFSWSEIERTLILGSWELWEGECRNARAQLFNTWHGSKMNFHRF